jgi:hypothetical protein
MRTSLRLGLVFSYVVAAAMCCNAYAQLAAPKPSINLKTENDRLKNSPTASDLIEVGFEYKTGLGIAINATSYNSIKLAPRSDGPSGSFEGNEFDKQIGECSRICKNDTKCAAYSVVKKTQFDNARCNLIEASNLVNLPQSGHPNAYSAYNLTSPVSNMNQPGFTYKNLSVDVSGCQAACDSERSCSGWTHTGSTCKLKNKIAAYITKAGYTSGGRSARSPN